MGLSSVVVLIRLKKFGLKTAQVIWFATVFFYLLSSLFFLMFVSEIFLRHIIVFLVSFLAAFWIKRFYEFVRSASPEPLGEGGSRDWSLKELDVYFLKVISFSSFYFGVSSIYGAMIFLGAHPLAMLAFFVLWVLGCTILFWEPSPLFLKTISPEKMDEKPVSGGVYPPTNSIKSSSVDASLRRETPDGSRLGFLVQPPRIGGEVKIFLWGLVTILCLEAAATVYFLPLSIFSMGAVVFLFWLLLANMLFDFNRGAFIFKKYRTRLILFAAFIILILLSIEWV